MLTHTYLYTVLIAVTQCMVVQIRMTPIDPWITMRSHEGVGLFEKDKELWSCWRKSVTRAGLWGLKTHTRPTTSDPKIKMQLSNISPVVGLPACNILPAIMIKCTKRWSCRQVSTKYLFLSELPWSWSLFTAIKQGWRHPTWGKGTP